MGYWLLRGADFQMASECCNGGQSHKRIMVLLAIRSGSPIRENGYAL